MKALFPISFACSVAAVFGTAKVVFGAHLVLATTVLGPRFGPVSVLALGSMDLVVGVISAMAGIAFMLRKRWARSVLVHGLLPFAFYEVGRQLGSMAAEDKPLSTGNAVILLITIACLVLAWHFARSAASDSFLSAKSPSVSQDIV
jgi:hypothetical protein